MGHTDMSDVRLIHFPDTVIQTEKTEEVKKLKNWVRKLNNKKNCQRWMGRVQKLKIDYKKPVVNRFQDL